MGHGESLGAVHRGGSFGLAWKSKLTRVLLNSRHTEGSQDLLILFCFVFVLYIKLGGEEWEEHYDVEQRQGFFL